MVEKWDGKEEKWVIYLLTPSSWLRASLVGEDFNLSSCTVSQSKVARITWQKVSAYRAPRGWGLGGEWSQ